MVIIRRIFLVALFALAGGAAPAQDRFITVAATERYFEIVSNIEK